MSPSHVPFDQAWESRKVPMANLITAAFANPISILEIGTWCGLGSTQVWLMNLLKGSKITLVDAWRPYASTMDLKDAAFDYRGMDVLSSDAFLSTYVAVRKFEAEHRDREVEVQLIRADTETFLPYLNPESFDFIYIDGDHKFEKVLSDIKNAKRLVKSDFGIICGDDLERLPTAALIDLAAQYKDRDFLREPHYFHPGVLLAVSQEFDHVSMINGFWWVVCRKGVFTNA
jgi:hypothetical protein